MGLLAVGGGLYTGFEIIVGEPQNTTTALAVAALALVGGAAMLKVAHGLATCAHWSRSPAVLTQLFLLPVAVSLVQSDQPQWGYPLIAVGVCSLIALFSRPVSLALYRSEEQEEERPD